MQQKLCLKPSKVNQLSLSDAENNSHTAEPQNPLASEWKNELRATISQAEECNNMFKELLEVH